MYLEARAFPLSKQKSFSVTGFFPLNVRSGLGFVGFFFLVPFPFHIT